MNEYSHRNSPVASVTSATDYVSAIARIAPVDPTTLQSDASRGNPTLPRIAPDVGSDAAHTGDEHARTRADYAKVHEQIAMILSSLDTQPVRDPASTVGQAQDAMAMLLPQPSIVLPLPPASDQMAQFITQVRQSILTQSARTRAAMSNVTSATVEAATA